MLIKINGKENEINAATNLFELVADRGLNQDAIVIEHNFEIIPKEKWEAIILKEEDNIEIVSFVGGG